MAERLYYVLLFALALTAAALAVEGRPLEGVCLMVAGAALGFAAWVALAFAASPERFLFELRLAIARAELER